MPDPQAAALVAAPVETVVAPVETVAPVESAVTPPADAAPAAAPATPAVEAQPDAAQTPSLIEQGDPDSPPAKADDAPAPAQEAAPETKAPVEKPPAPVFADFALPEGFVPDKERIGSFTEKLGESIVDLELLAKSGDRNAVNAAAQQLGQHMLDMHVAEIQRMADATAQHQRDVWAETNKRWIDEVKSDPEIGGNRQQTALGAAKSVIERFGGTPEQRQALYRDLGQDTGTGMGNNPNLIRLLHNVASAIAEGTSVPATTPVAPPKSRSARWYGSNGANP